MRKPVVAANWKMHGNLDLANQLVKDIIAGIDNKTSQPDLIFCPPAILIPMVSELLKETNLSDVFLGAQNTSQHESGAYTGEIAANMLNEFKCRYAIVGHSERRSLYGETNKIVAEKFTAVQNAGLSPILCIGETLEQRKSGAAKTVIEEQLGAININMSEHASPFIIAYEPVWAIGTGQTASPEQAQEMHAHIRQVLVNSAGDTTADSTRILYGGSVKANNAESLFCMPDIDGGLIGGASLDAKEFLTIYKSI